MKDTKLLRGVEKKLVQAIGRWQRRRARELGIEGAVETGAVSFVQVFNGLLLLQPHLHLLVAEGVWSAGELVELPPPSTQEVESVLTRMLERLKPLFEAYEPQWPEDGFEALQFQGAQLRLKSDENGQRERLQREKRGRRVAVGAGFSLHADTVVSANDPPGPAGAVWSTRGHRGVAIVAPRGRALRVPDEKRRHAGADRRAACEAAHLAHRAEGSSPHCAFRPS